MKPIVIASCNYKVEEVESDFLCMSQHKNAIKSLFKERTRFFRSFSKQLRMQSEHSEELAAVNIVAKA
jgi:hypothetical protein